MQLIFILTIFYILLENSAKCIPLGEFYPFGNGAAAEFGNDDTFLPPNDDDSSPPILLTSVFPFFDENFDTIIVNTNGAISFTYEISQYTPDAFPTNATEEIIAPYWADVDIRGTGNIGYRETRNPDLLQRANNDIRRAFSTIRFSSEYLFIATWDHVGYFDSQVDKTNTFQAVLATDGLLSFVIFLYADDKIQWTTGKASNGTDGLGGTPAQVGFDAGDGIRYFTVPGSRTDEIINVAETSNVGIPGMWIFRIDGQEVEAAGCQIINATDDGFVPLTLFPRYGSVLGGTAVQVFGPCFNEFTGHSIYCLFDDIKVQAIHIDTDFIICVSPRLTTLGRINFILYVDDVRAEFQESTFYSLAIDEGNMINTNNEVDLFFMPNEVVEITWDTESLLPQSLVEQFNLTVTVDIQLFELDAETGSTQLLTNLATDILNIGHHSVTIPSMFSEVSSTVFQVTVAEVQSLIESVSGQVEAIIDDIRGQVSQWSNEVYVSGSDYLRDKCDEWCESEPEDIGEKILERLPPCPPTTSRARADNDFEEEDFGDEFRETFHPNTSSCFRQVAFTEENEGSGQQCCYDKNEDLKVGPPGGGTVDLYTPAGFWGELQHFRHDVLPFFYCCKGEFSNCDAYYKRRPSDDGSRYVLQPPACVYGDPHMVTLDGYKYTFNGKGEFTLVKHKDDMFTLQARMVEIENSNGIPASATVFSAIAAKQHDSDVVEFRQSRRGLDAFVDGVMVDFEDLPKQDYGNVTLSNLGNQTLSALFSCGAYIQAKVENGIISVLLVSLPDSFYNATYGLMGVFNKDMTDDLMIKNSTQYLPLNSSNEDIHWQFGLSWIVSREESLFTYQLRESWQTFYDPAFTPLFMPVFANESFEAEAREACNNDTFCLYDIASTGRMDIGLSTLDGSRDFDEIVQLSYPTVCDPPCVQGACVANDTCNCAEGYVGERCTEPVYTECETNRCENGGSCIKLGVSYICACTDGYSGSLCEAFIGEDEDEDFVDQPAFIVIIVLGVVGVIVAVAIAVIIITVVSRHHINKRKEQHTENALTSAHVNLTYAVNEAYASNEKDNKMDSVKAAVNQDVRLTENVYEPIR